MSSVQPPDRQDAKSAPTYAQGPTYDVVVHVSGYLMYPVDAVIYVNQDVLKLATKHVGRWC